MLKKIVDRLDAIHWRTWLSVGTSLCIVPYVLALFELWPLKMALLLSLAGFILEIHALGLKRRQGVAGTEGQK